MVGPDGHATNCELLEASGHADLDAKTCQLFVAKLRFKPALDNDGKAMAAPYQFRMMWDISR